MWFLRFVQLHKEVFLIGSFSCTCSGGYELLIDGQQCIDINECEDILNPCNGGKCINTAGGYSCVCSGGLMMGQDALSCVDLDECSINKDVCRNGKCENTLGSFKCLCDDGYSVKGDLMADGCTDEDECSLDLYHCDPNADCKNTDGSYECTCKSGYSGDGFDCQDVNECLIDNGGCDSNAKCLNTPGSFMCTCDSGFSGDGVSCTDIDECASDPTLCENGACVNNPGSFNCDCQKGFMHPLENQEECPQVCVDIDECSVINGGKNVCLNGHCTNLKGGFQCECFDGFRLDPSGANCTDIDECADPQTCRRGQCINEHGGHQCICPESYILLDSGAGCVDVRTGKCYSEFNMTINGAGLCGGDLTTSGPFGMEGVTQSTCCCSIGAAWGVSECQHCPDPSSEEYNFICPGGRGFQPNVQTVILEDINECQELRGMCQNGRCLNTFGSYMCSCDRGFELDPKGVRDIPTFSFSVEPPFIFLFFRSVALTSMNV